MKLSCFCDIRIQWTVSDLGVRVKRKRREK